MDRRIGYPRVLILGCNFDLRTGGGITLTNLFAGWPTDRLAVAGFHSCDVNPAPCGHQYLLGRSERRWIQPLQFARVFDNTHHEQPGPGTTPRSGPPSSMQRAKCQRLRAVAKMVFGTAARCLGSDDYLRPLCLSEQLLCWSTSFRPDLLYTQLASVGMIRLTMELASALDVPIAVHMMDDWPQVIYRHGLLGRQLRSQTDCGLRTIIDGAAARLAISDAMALEYAERYGHEWSVFHNPVDLARWSAAQKYSWRSADEFRLVYSGRIGAGIESSLLDICRAVATLRRKGRRLRFDIYSLHFDITNDPRFAGFQGVALYGAIAH
jgi:hypothetical protein